MQPCKFFNWLWAAPHLSLFSSFSPPPLLLLSSFSPPSLLLLSSFSPPSLLLLSSFSPPSLLSSFSPPSLLLLSSFSSLLLLSSFSSPSLLFSFFYLRLLFSCLLFSRLDFANRWPPPARENKATGGVNQPDLKERDPNTVYSTDSSRRETRRSNLHLRARHPGRHSISQAPET
jgi:hypothetical protein